MLQQVTLVATPDPALRYLLGRALDDADIRSSFALSRRELYDALHPRHPATRRGEPVGAVIVDVRRSELGVEPLVWLASAGVTNPLIVIADEDDAVAPRLAEDAEASALFHPDDDPAWVVDVVQIGLRARGLSLALAGRRRRRVPHAARRR